MNKQNSGKESILRRAGQYQGERIGDLFLDEAMPYIHTITHLLLAKRAHVDNQRLMSGKIFTNESFELKNIFLPAEVGLSIIFLTLRD